MSMSFGNNEKNMNTVSEDGLVKLSWSCSSARQVHCVDNITTYHYFSKALEDVKQVMVSSRLLKVSNE